MTVARRAGSVSAARQELTVTPARTRSRLGSGRVTAMRTVARPRAEPPSPSSIMVRRSCRSARTPASGLSRTIGARAHSSIMATDEAVPKVVKAQVARAKAVMPEPMELTREPMTRTDSRRMVSPDISTDRRSVLV